MDDIDLPESMVAVPSIEGVCLWRVVRSVILLSELVLSVCDIFGSWEYLAADNACKIKKTQPSYLDNGINICILRISSFS